MEPHHNTHKRVDGIHPRKKITHIPPAPTKTLVRKDVEQRKPDIDSFVPPARKTKTFQSKAYIPPKEGNQFPSTYPEDAQSPILYTNKKHIFGNRRVFKLVLGLALIGVIFVLFSSFDKTRVDIVAATETQGITQKVTAHLYPNTDQLGFDVIAVSVEDTLVLNPETDTEIREKASGTVRIFNHYSTQPQRLSEGTRLETVGGQIFKIPLGSTITIPGKTGDTPGSVDVLVYADEPGPDYNIDLTDFSIPGFREAGLDKKFADIYAVSTGAMTGGFIGTKKVLSDDQIQKAQASLSDNVQFLLQQRINAEKTNQFFLVDGAGEIQFAPIEITEDGENLRLVQKAQGSRIILSKEHLNTYIQNTFFPENPDHRLIITGYENLEITRAGTGPLEGKDQAVLEISADVSYSYDLDPDTLVQNIMSRDIKTLLPLFIETKEISYAKVNVFPFWRKTTSDLADRFKVDILAF